MVELLKALMKLSRIEHGVMVAIGVIAGAVSSGSIESLSSKGTHIVLGSLAAILIEMGLFTFNDVFNIEEDKVNSPDRPLVRGCIGIREASLFGALTLIVGMLLSLIIGPISFILILLVVMLGMAYNVSLKRKGFLGNVAVAFNTAMPFVYGALLMSNITGIILLFYLMAFFSALGREVIKGIKDLRGDIRVGTKTLAAKYGSLIAARIAASFIVIAVIMSPLPILLVKNPIGYTTLILLTDTLLLYSSYKIVVNPDEKEADKQRKITLLAMGAGIVGFALSNL